MYLEPRPLSWTLNSLHLGVWEISNSTCPKSTVFPSKLCSTQLPLSQLVAPPVFPVAQAKNRLQSSLGCYSTPCRKSCCFETSRAWAALPSSLLKYYNSLLTGPHASHPKSPSIPSQRWAWPHHPTMPHWGSFSCGVSSWKFMFAAWACASTGMYLSKGHKITLKSSDWWRLSSSN